MIYLDNSATTQCSGAAIEIIEKVLREDYGNPSSLHGMGVKAEGYLKHTREVIAKKLHATEREIIFTSGGSEAINLGLIGAATAYRRSGMHIITTPIEHPAVQNTLKYLQDEFGFEVEQLPVDGDGVIDLVALADMIRQDTIMVAIMHVNNEIGTIEPVEEAARIIRQKNPSTLFFVDAVQSFGKLPIQPSKAGIDLMAVSGHKLHGPKGSGFLYVKDKVKLRPLIHGGGQEWGLRSGTENVPAIAGLGAAIEELESRMDTDSMYDLRQRFVEAVSKIEGVTINGSKTAVAPHIISVSVEGVRSEVLLHALEDEGVYVSAGSACSSHKRTPSATLSAIGLKKSLIESTVRFSMSADTTWDELHTAYEKLSGIVPKLRKFTHK